jgi:hypothetical protein
MFWWVYLWAYFVLEMGVLFLDEEEQAWPD